MDLERHKHEQWRAMAEIGEPAAAILKVVIDQISSVIEGQITLQQDFTTDLKKMKMALESIQAVLGATERLIMYESMRLWLKRLKDAMFAISDTIDELKADTQPSGLKFSVKRHLEIVIPCLTIDPKTTMAKKMGILRLDLEVITDQYSKLQSTGLNYTSEPKAIDTRETQVVGRTKEKEKILCYLSESMTNEMTILPIYGIGGLGKTTLAKMVYNSSQFKNYSHVWVHVSQTFDLEKIGSSIISQLSENGLQTEVTTIQSLSEMLAGQKILVVLDDLWENEESYLDALKAMLKVGKESKVVVIVTTRAQDIAKKISTIQPYKLEPLTDDMCWSIIKENSAFESRGDKEHLEQIGMDIAVKCAGVALAAQSLGHMLYYMTSGEWESVRNSNIWNISTSKDTAFTHVLASLRLSYSVLPPNLRLCFAYCAIFPKGHKILKDDLIHQWVSLGFIYLPDVISSWQVGDIYIAQLLGLCFLESSKSPSTAEPSLEDITILTMHDLVHDLARSVMDDKMLVSSEHGNHWESSFRYALLNDCNIPSESSKIRALRFMDCSLHGVTFSSAESLRVLDLSECVIHKLPDSIGLLKQLRYLNAPRVQDSTIPNSITGLSKLVYLKLRGSSAILALPESIGEMGGLVYLDLSGCSGIKELPESFGRLEKLVHLDLSNCSRLRDLSKISGSFINLRYFNLSGCHYLEELPKLFGTHESLVHLDLSNCPKVNGVPNALGGLTNLKYLNLSRTRHGIMPRLRGLPEVIGNLTNLRYLNLSRCMSSIFENYSDSASKFRIDSFMYRISTLSNLEHLELSRNDAISTVPQSLGNLKKEYRRNLKKVHTSSMAIPCFAVCASDRKSSSNLVLLQHMDPDELNINSLENVKSAEEAGSIKLMEKKRLEDLTLEWRRDAERFVNDKVLLEKLAPPSTLMKLEISGYNSVSFPAWLMGQLPNLELLVLRGMERLEEWNMSYASDEEYMIEELEIYDCPKLRMEQIPRATKLKISKSDNLLSSWGQCTVSHNGASTSSSPVTTILQVEYSKLSLDQWRLIHHLPGLTGLSVSHCDDLTISPKIIRCLSSLIILSVAAKDQEELPEWLGELTSLRQLNIVRYTGATKLPDNMRQLTNLQSLNMYGCSSMPSLPHWLGEISYLRTLYIFGCDGIESLPVVIQQLCNLQELEIYNCPKLMHWVESEENEMKVTHNQECVCVLPTSLKKLVIWECHGIISLPEGIHQLSDLQQLQIYLCPLLKQWCESEENLTKLAHIEEKDIR